MLEDVTLAEYLAELHDQGRAPASASTAVAAARFRAGASAAGEDSQPETVNGNRLNAQNGADGAAAP